MNENEKLKVFIREHRSNEANFEKLYARLEEEIKSNTGSEKYAASLQEIKAKAAEDYKTAKLKGGTAWPEFEKFTSDFEKAVVNEP